MKVFDIFGRVIGTIFKVGLSILAIGIIIGILLAG